MRMTIAQAAEALRQRTVSSVELTEECLRNIDRLNPSLNAFITVTAEIARARARDMDRELAAGLARGPLHGIPVAHKDIIATAGVRTTSGSILFADHVPEADAAVVRALNDAGAVMVGKTGLHELAYGVTSDNPHFGPIRNPCDTERTPGGSSGGSGVAVATAMAFVATGTDTGGSIRIPASYCGVVGFKPTYGFVSRLGVQPLGLTLDHVGPLASSVRACWIALDAMAHDRRLGAAPDSIGRVRIGIPENYYFENADPEVAAAVERAANVAQRLGARLIAVRVPDIDRLNAVARVILLTEASAVYEKYAGRRHEFGSDVLSLLDQGRLVPATAYVNAQRLRKRFVNKFQIVFDQVDCLFTPTTPITAPRIGEREIAIRGELQETRLATTRFVRGFNALGLPALSIPCGRSRSGLPIGLQIVGRPYEDNLVLAVGEALESAA